VEAALALKEVQLATAVRAEEDAAAAAAREVQRGRELDKRLAAQRELRSHTAAAAAAAAAAAERLRGEVVAHTACKQQLLVRGARRDQAVLALQQRVEALQAALGQQRAARGKAEARLAASLSRLQVIDPPCIITHHAVATPPHSWRYC
jgi:hypothetical protein